MTKKYKILIGLIIASLSLTFANENCAQLQDGNYELKFNDKLEHNYKFKIDHEYVYRYFENGYCDTAIVKWIGNCKFILEFDKSKLDEVDKKLQQAFGNHGIAFEYEPITFELAKDSILHIISTQGEIYKTK